MYAHPAVAVACNGAVTLFILGVGVGLFVAVNGSPRQWREFLAREPDRGVRMHRWRKRVQGYFAAFGATVGHGVASGGFLVVQRSNAAGQIVACDLAVSAAGLCAGLLAGLTLGASAALSLRIAPEPGNDDD